MSLAKRWSCAALYLFLLLPAATLAGDGLAIEDGWVREAPPGARVLAGYMTLHNSGQAAIRISGVSGDDFSSIEIHRTVIEDGMARMLSIGEIDLPPGGSFNLEPGGYHLMLFNPARRLVSGDRVRLSLHIDNGPCIPVTLDVRRTPE